MNDIKAKMPFGKKPADDVEEEVVEDESGDKTELGIRVDQTDSTDISDVGEFEDVDEAPKSLLDKIKAKFKKQSSNDEDEDKAKGKKPVNKAILYGAVITIIGVVFYEDIMQMIVGEEVVEAPVLKPRAKPLPRKKPEEIPTPTPAPTDIPPVETAASATSAPVATPDVPAVEAPADPTTTSSESISVSDLAEPTTDIPESNTTDVAPVVEPDTNQPVVVAPEETPMIGGETNTDSIDGNIQAPKDENLTEQILDDLEKQAKTDKEEKKIQKEYVAPPDYEYHGRGLVYNCVGKHWACIDAPSYKTCESNSQSNTYLKKKTECYPHNVYDTVKGCETMQNRMVSSSAKTNFCK